MDVLLKWNTFIWRWLNVQRNCFKNISLIDSSAEGKYRQAETEEAVVTVSSSECSTSTTSPDGSPLKAGPSTEPTHSMCSLNLRLTSVRILTTPFSSQAILETVLNILACMPVLSHVMWPHGLEPARLLCSHNFSGKHTGVGCHFHLQGTFPTQGWSPSLPSFLHYRQVPFCWATGEVPNILEPTLFFFFNL